MRFGERVFETTDTEGTGDYALAGAATGHQTFLAGIGAGDLVGYTVTDGTNWETGFGTLSSGPATLTRAGIIDSSNSGAAYNWGPGTKNIYCGPIGAVFTSLIKTHKGSAAPAWLPPGALWVDDSASPWLLKIKKTSGSVTLGRVDATNGRFISEAVKAADIASASVLDLGAATGDYIHITGTTGITELGTADAGIERTLVFDGALVLTHHATKLILPGGVNITTAAGDAARFRSEGGNSWKCVAFQRAGGIDGADIRSGTVPAARMPTFTLDVQIITASGNWTKPAGAIYSDVELLGGGGGGARNVTNSAFGGGGAGGYSRKHYLASALDATEAVVIGAAGPGRTSGTGNGTAGGASTFKGQTANGGGAGTTSDGGNGGTASGGDINIQGQGGYADGSNNRSWGGLAAGGLGVPGSRDQNGATSGFVDAHGYGCGGAGNVGANAGNGAPGVCIVRTLCIT